MSDVTVLPVGVVVAVGLGDGLGFVAGVEGVEEVLGRIVPVGLEEGSSLTRPDCAERLLAGRRNKKKTSVAKTRR